MSQPMSQPPSRPTSQPTSPSIRAAFFADPKHGPLPALLLLLTVVTGVIDAVSILSLGRVFVANMTGNVVFVGFALAGAPGFALGASLFALGGFLAGALGGGFLIGRLGPRRGAQFRIAVTIELILVGAALVIAIAAGAPFTTAPQDLIAAACALAMGLQNAVVRKLAVPDLTTTVLTMTLTGIAADVRAGQRGPALLRRFLAVAAMLGGAVAWALLVLHPGPQTALGVAVGLLAVVAAGSWIVQRRPAAWQVAVHS